MPQPRIIIPASLGEVEELLSWCDPETGGHHTWQRMVSAIHDTSGGSDEGLALAHRWSSRGKTYDPANLTSRWPTFTAGRGGGTTVATIAAAAHAAGADVVGIGGRHRLMRAHVAPTGAGGTPTGATGATGATGGDVVDLILDRVRTNPVEAVHTLAAEIARLPVSDREKVLAECKQFGIKQEMQAAVKRALADRAVASGTDTASAVAAGPLSHFFIVRNDNGQAVAVDGRGDMPPQSRAAMRDAFSGLAQIPIPSGDSFKMIHAVDYWWSQPGTLTYDALGYDPTAPLEYLDTVGRSLRNVYRPGHVAPPVPMARWAVRPFLYLVQSNFPDPDDQRKLLQALAFMAHRPGALLRWAPVMQGSQGCGKGLIARAVSYSVGRHNTSHPSPDIIATDFNGYMYRKVLIIVDEIGDHTKRELSALSEKLKPWITDTALHIHQKGRDGFDTTNHTCWILTTNHRDKMLASEGERRYAHFISVIQTKKAVDAAYQTVWWRDSPSWSVLGAGQDWFTYYEHWWAMCGGAEAVRGFLSTVDLSGVPVRAPETTSTVEAIREGASDVHNSLAEAVANGFRGFRGGFISSNAIRDLLRSDNIRPPHSTHLARALAAVGFKHSVRVTTSPAERLAFPDAGTKTRIYHTGSLEPHVVAARHDQALAEGPPPVPAGVIRIV